MLLELKSVKRHFGGVKAVDGCTFGIKEGQITALIGPNGAGKSTVFNIISGLIEANGSIHFNGEPISGLSPEKIARAGIARLFQHARLFSNLTVEENLMLALHDQDMHLFRNVLGLSQSAEQKKKVHDILKLVHMERFLHKTTEGMSFGQKRLIEIARTLLFPHKLVMLDEPVAGVTPPLRRVIAELLNQLKKEGESMLLIEHDMQFTLSVADHVIVMDAGKVLASGTPDEIRKNPHVLEAYLGE